MLSPRKINLIDPSKENRSKDQPRSPQKNSYQNLHNVITKLLIYIHSSSPSIPQDILKFLPPNFQHMLSTLPRPPTPNQQDNTQTQSHSQLTNKINDLKFQIKKIEQDSATQIYQLKLASSKQQKKIKQQYNQLQALYKKQSLSLQEKVHQVKMYYEGILEEYKVQEKENSEKRFRNVQERFLGEIQEYKQELARNREFFEKQKEEIREQSKLQIEEKQKQIVSVIQTKQQQKTDQYQKYQQRIKNLQILWQNRKNAWQEQKKQINIKHQEEKLVLIKQKQKLYTDLYLVRKDNGILKNNIIELQKKIAELEVDVKKGENKNVVMEKQHQKEIKRIQDRQQFSLEQEQLRYREELRSNLEMHEKFLEEKQQKIEMMEQLRIKEVEGLRQTIAEMEQIFQRRQPRKEDMDKIQKYQRIFVKKQLQIKQLKQNYQRMMLERDNNEKNYNRIFSAHPSSRKHSTNKQVSGSTQKLAKKPYTVDFSFILKALNKNI